MCRQSFTLHSALYVYICFPMRKKPAADVKAGGTGAVCRAWQTKHGIPGLIQEMRKYNWLLGASGYVGNAVLRVLREKHPDRPVTALANKTMTYELTEHTNLLTGGLENFDFTWLDRFPPDTVYHCARIGGRTDLLRRRAGEAGRRANERWLEALAALPDPPRVVYCSGSLMYGNCASARENNPMNPIAYGKEYIKAEIPWIEAKSVLPDVRMYRPGWIMGPDSWFLHFFWLPYLKSGQIPLYGNPGRKMSLIHLEDCAGLMVHAAEVGAPGKDFNPAPLKPITAKEFTETVAEQTGATVVRISAEETEKKYGKTVAEALCSDCALETDYPETAAGYVPRYPSTELLIRKVLSDLRGLSKDE